MRMRAADATVLSMRDTCRPLRDSIEALLEEVSATASSSMREIPVRTASSERRRRSVDGEQRPYVRTKEGGCSSTSVPGTGKAGLIPLGYGPGQLNVGIRGAHGFAPILVSDRCFGSTLSYKLQRRTYRHRRPLLLDALRTNGRKVNPVSLQ